MISWSGLIFSPHGIMEAGTHTLTDTPPAVPYKTSRTGTGDLIFSWQPGANLAGVNLFRASGSGGSGGCGSCRSCGSGSCGGGGHEGNC